MANALIFQIFYDDKSKRLLDDGFCGLDNTSQEFDGWYEFSPIFEYLSSNRLDDDVWYGFLSPKFRSKTGCDAAYVHDFLDRVPQKAEVVIFSPGWEQLSYFLNPWEQGEVWHPTIAKVTQEFLSVTGRPADLRSLVTDLTTSVFSNYFVAKKRFWMAWLAVAKDLKQFVSSRADVNDLLISYGSLNHKAPMKAFMQERLASYVLAAGDFVSVASRRVHAQPVMRRLFPDGEADRKLFFLCDRFKHLYRTTQNKAYLDAFYFTRQNIRFEKPHT